MFNAGRMAVTVQTQYMFYEGLLFRLCEQLLLYGSLAPSLAPVGSVPSSGDRDIDFVTGDTRIESKVHVHG